MNTPTLQARGSGKIRYTLGLLAASVVGLALAPTEKAEAHGYVTGDLKSRLYMCQLGQNTNCGQFQYEPYSAEYRLDYPRMDYPSAGAKCAGTFAHCGPADGWIASAGMLAEPHDYARVNEQTATRWAKNPVRPGAYTLKWAYSAGHPVAYKEFYITKNGWNPNAPLSRDAFELTPIARYEMNGAMPTGNETYPINIPHDRLGYHVILATWKTSDTSATFYQVIDVDVQNDSGVPSQWKDIGTVAAEPLKAGSKVVTRVFTKHGEQPQRSRTLDIESDAMGQPNIWPMTLATIIPASDGYRIGVVNNQDEVVPSPDGNHIYVAADSDVTQVMLDKQHAALPSEIRITGLADSHSIIDGRTSLHYSAIATGSRKFTIFTNVIDSVGETVAFDQGETGNNQQHFSITVENALPGEYDVVVRGTSNDEEQEVVQATQRIKLVEQPVGGDYDYVFPEGLGEYKAGTKVLGKDGGIYQCKAWPYDGYCRQWTPDTNGFEPGAGHAWTSAWDRL